MIRFPSPIQSAGSRHVVSEARATSIPSPELSLGELNILMRDDATDEDLDLDLFLTFTPSNENQGLCTELDNQQGPSQGLDNDRQVVQQSVAKRKSSNVSMALRKKRSANENHPQPHSNSLAAYLSDETRRCMEQGHQPPLETFFTPKIQAEIQDLCEPMMGILEKILVYIAGSHSIAVLRELLDKPTTVDEFKFFSAKAKLSNAERFNLIQKLDTNVILLLLLRRHHVLELFRECRRLAPRPDDGFVLTTPYDYENHEIALNMSGNPIHSAEAKVTANMMAELCPNIEPDSRAYKSKYRMVKGLHKLGHRLDRLEKVFGNGILGLMPDRGITGQFNVGITDYM